MAPPTDTRLGPGTLKLATIDFGSQLSNVMLEPSQDSSDGTPTLGDPDPLPEVTESWVISGTAVQDWEDPDGFVNYCADHALTVVAFEWTPNSDAGVKWTGDCLLTSIPIGGDVSTQNTSDFEFAVQGVPVRDDGEGLPAGVTSRGAAAARARRRSSIASPAPTAKRRRGKATHDETAS